MSSSILHTTHSYFKQYIVLVRQSNKNLSAFNLEFNQYSRNLVEKNTHSAFVEMLSSSNIRLHTQLQCAVQLYEHGSFESDRITMYIPLLNIF